jgi:outer membrane protein assembly factor BamB
MALDKKTGEKLWEYDIDAPIAPVGPSIGGGMLFIPTGKVQGMSEKEDAKGSIIAFGLP